MSPERNVEDVVRGLRGGAARRFSSCYMWTSISVVSATFRVSYNINFGGGMYHCCLDWPPSERRCSFCFRQVHDAGAVLLLRGTGSGGLAPLRSCRADLHAFHEPHPPVC